MAIAVDAGDVTRILLKHGANVNASNAGGVTPLHLAAALGREETAQALLAGSASPNAKTARDWIPGYGLEPRVIKKGTTPLGLARAFQREHIARLVRKYGGRE